MKYSVFGALALLVAGCARQQTPAVAVSPTAIPTSIPTPQITVIAPPLEPATPTPNAETMARKAVVLREIARLQNASPEVDFAANWAKGDKRFVGINGVGGYFPSLPKERVLALLNQYGATTIEGTGDVMEFPEQEELGRLAMIYATRYNPLLLKKLDEENAVN